MADTKRNNQLNIIEDIRKRKGIGAGREVGDNEGDLHRAIDRLSKDIYSKDVHFILELIQNAEDNPYSSGKDPQLIFKILDQDPFNSPKTEGALLVINNEEGFQEKNVRAICSIGETTKSKREGYIGEKGIGFKSVFQITANPHIFSAGYQFSFSDKPDKEVGFGYIIPYWMNEFPQIIKELQDHTCILLPLREGKRKAVQDELQQIAPETILFLNKLKALQIYINDQIVTKVYRDDSAYPRVKILNNETSFFYWLSELNFEKNKEINEEKREGINFRKVSVSFPINMKKRPIVGVFAFLPTSPNLQSGFDFMINGDFLLSANREQIFEHLPWNMWLRDCIAPCFLKGFEEMLLKDELRINAYQFIPLINENRSDFFKPTVNQIIENLQEKNVILTDSGVLVKPESARFASIEIRDLLGNDSLPAFLKTVHLIHSELEDNQFHERLESIGVIALSGDEILECLRDDEWITQHDLEWFFKLYKFLYTKEWANKDALAEIKLIPVQSGSILRPSDNSGVYFPDGKADELAKEHTEAIQYSDIQFLNEVLYKKIFMNYPLVKWVEEVLILFVLNMSMISQELAIKLQNDSEKLQGKTLIWATKLICYYWSELGESQKDVVRENLPLLLDNDRIIFSHHYKPDSPLVFPENLNTKSGWQLVFSDPEDREHMKIISKKYLRGEEKEKITDWKVFFSEIGASISPFPKKIKWNVDYHFPEEAPQIHKTMWDKNEYSTRGKTLFDWKTPGWLKNPGEDKKEINVKRAKALVEWLESQVNELNNSWYEPEWVNAKIEYFYRTPQVQINKSEFLHFLRNSNWLPTNQGLKRPSEVFINQLEFKELFGNTIPLSEIKISSELASWLNVKTSATYQEILDFLRSLPDQTTETVSIKLLKKIYAFISERWKQESRELFSKEPLIFIPKSEKKWFFADEVIWLNKSEVFEDFFGYLEDDYEDLKNFFLEKLNVKFDVDDEVYARKWKSMSQNSEGYEAKKIETALERIFSVLLGVAKKESKPDWWNEFKNSVMFWTQNDCFVQPSFVFVPDDSDFKKVFHELGVEFAWVPPKDSFFDYQILYSELGVRSLSENVEISAEIEGSRILTEEPILLTAAVKRAICYYLRNQARPVYERLKENGVLETFLQTKEYLVEKLNLSLVLFDKHEEINDGIAYYDQNQEVLYLSDNFSQDDWNIHVPSMIARKLVRTQIANELEGIIGWIVSVSEKGIKGIIEKRNWAMPKEERKWLDEIIKSTNETMLMNDSGSEEELEDEFVSDDGNDETKEITEGEEITGVRKKLSDADDLIEQPKVGGEERQSEQGKKPGSSSTSSDYSTGFSHQTGTSVGSARKPSDEKRMTTRLSSYVYPEGEISTYKENPAFSIKRGQKGKKGVELVMQYERERGHIPKDMEEEQTNHPGYDIESKDLKGEILYIEVKATESLWDSQHPASLTRFEFKTAKELGEKYWLYVVEKVNSEDYKIYEINDPVNRISQYSFDHDWLPRVSKNEDV
jgi:hypothetical protein